MIWIYPPKLEDCKFMFDIAFESTIAITNDFNTLVEFYVAFNGIKSSIPGILLVVIWTSFSFYKDPWSSYYSQYNHNQCFTGRIDWNMKCVDRIFLFSNILRHIYLHLRLFQIILVAIWSGAIILAIPQAVSFGVVIMDGSIPQCLPKNIDITVFIW